MIYITYYSNWYRYQQSLLNNYLINDLLDTFRLGISYRYSIVILPCVFTFDKVHQIRVCNKYIVYSIINSINIIIILILNIIIFIIINITITIFKNIIFKIIIIILIIKIYFNIYKFFLNIVKVHFSIVIVFLLENIDLKIYINTI